MSHFFLYTSCILFFAAKIGLSYSIVSDLWQYVPFVTSLNKKINK